MQKTGISRDTRISNAAVALIDAKYHLGNTDKGFDCLNSIGHFYRKMGVILPKEFQGWNEENYSTKFALNPDEGRRILFEFIMSLGNEILQTHFKAGDLMVFKHKDDPPFPGIYLGASNVLLVVGNPHGVKVFPLKTIETLFGNLIHVRRLIR